MKTKATRRLILDSAAQAVLKDRQSDHGSPEDTFSTHAALFSAYLSAKTGVSIDLDSADVAALMILFKVGRIAANSAHGDNWIDAAGYAACGGELAAAMVEEPDTGQGAPLRVFGPVSALGHTDATK